MATGLTPVWKNTYNSCSGSDIIIILESIHIQDGALPEPRFRLHTKTDNANRLADPENLYQVSREF